MEQNIKTVQKKSKTPLSSIFMYIGSAIVGLIGLANIYLVVSSYTNTVKQYVAQGYTVAEVNKVLIPQQLIPGVLEPLGTYFGIAFVLICAAIINNKLSRCLHSLAKDEPVCSTECIEQAVPVEEAEAVETTEPVEGAEAVSDSEPAQAAEEE